LPLGWHISGFQPEEKIMKKEIETVSGLKVHYNIAQWQHPMAIGTERTTPWG